MLGGEWREAGRRTRSAVRSRHAGSSLPDGTAVVESAEAVGLGCSRPRSATRCSRRRAGLGELLLAVLAAAPAAVLVCVGGTATVDQHLARIALEDREEKLADPRVEARRGAVSLTPTSGSRSTHPAGRAAVR